MHIAVCFACDEIHFPLCKGLVLSIKETLRFLPPAWVVSLNCIDTGCSESNLAFFADQAIAVHAFPRKKFLPGIDSTQIPQHMDARLCRPFLPAIVQGQDMYIWISNDIWVQGQDALTVIVDAAARIAGKILICPEKHYGYINAVNPRDAVMARVDCYTALYGKAVAEDLSFRPMFATNLFALETSSLVWNKWADEIVRLYAVERGENSSVLLLAEQFALNYILYRDKAFIPLDPLFNYDCSNSAVFLNPQGKVLVGFPPFTPLKCVHLSQFSRHGQTYLDKKLLYREGEYLANTERAMLEALLKQPTS